MKIIDRKFLNTQTTTCHASTIAFFKDKPVFAWFGGSREGQPDSSIYVQYDGEIKCKIGARIAHWNPILFTIGEELFLSYKIGEFCDRWTTFILNITDIDHIDRSKAQMLPAGLNFCVKTKPIMNGNVLHCGSSVETKLDWTSYEETYEYGKGKFVFIERSKPLTAPKKEVEVEGRYFGEKKKFISQGIIQPSLWQDDQGLMHAFFRSSRGLGFIYYSFCNASSWGDGEWKKPVPTKLLNPNSGVDTVYYDGKLFLVYNPSDKNRYPLIIREMDTNDDDYMNNGKEIVITEDIERSEGTHSRELSYPYMIEEDGKLHLVYTYGRSKIEYVVIDLEGK